MPKKLNKQELKKLQKKARQYMPVLERMGKHVPRSQWENQAPRLNEFQKMYIQKLKDGIYQKIENMPISRETFIDVHERIEKELHEELKAKMGLIAGIEWSVTLHENAAAEFAKIGYPPVIHAVIPTPDIVEEDEFWNITERFHPVVILFQFDDPTKFFDAAESAIRQAENRRKDGDGYFTQRDRDINWRPQLGNDEAYVNEG
jgi:hypothetical protein